MPLQSFLGPLYNGLSFPLENFPSFPHANVLCVALKKVTISKWQILLRVVLFLEAGLDYCRSHT